MKRDDSRPQSAYRQLAAYFDRNRDDELTLDDICTKFGIAKKTADTYISRMKAEGAPIETVHVIRYRGRL